MLKLSAGVQKVCCASQGDEALAVIATHGSPVLTVMDFWLDEGQSLPFIQNILSLAPSTRILMTSGDKHPAIVSKAKAAGAHGFVHKSSLGSEFQVAVQALLAGLCWFDTVMPEPALPASVATTMQMTAKELGITARQAQVMALVLRGKPNRAIAQTLNLSEHTVKEHVTALLQRLGASNRVELITRMRGIELDLD